MAGNRRAPITLPAIRRALIALPVALAAMLACAAGATPAAAAVPRDFFGVNAVRPSNADFTAMGQFGLGTVRVEVGWRTVQATEGGGFRWSKIDPDYRRAAEARLSPLPVVLGTPHWISPEGRPVPPVRNQRFRSEWQRFVATFYLRYGPGGAFWRNNPELDGSLARDELILWNEQNAKAFWAGGADPGEYATLLRITRNAIKRRFPQAEIVIGGMYGYPTHRKSMKMTTFLKRLYRKPGVNVSSDGVALHPYAPAVAGVERQLRRARRIMRAAGEGHEGLWVSEIGWASEGGSGARPRFLIKTEKRQALLLKRSYRLLLAKRERWRIRSGLWFTWRDFGGMEVCGWCPHAGLLRRNGDPKPSGEAYRALIDART